MNLKTYHIEYDIYFKNGSHEPHIINIKNCMGELHSKIRLEEYLKKKHLNFDKLIVRSCIEDVLGFFSNSGKKYPFGNSSFGDDNPFDSLFGSDNPFKSK